MNRAQAEVDLRAIFQKYRQLSPTDTALIAALNDGKVYELFVLAHLVEELARRGYRLSFVGKTLKFKAAPGMIKAGEPHFTITDPKGKTTHRLFVNIEFQTLGSLLSGGRRDLSQRHELDIVATSAGSGYPGVDEIAFAVECKSGAMGKGIVKEVLGVRREMGFLANPQPATLRGNNRGLRVPHDPPTEFWVAFADPKGLCYAASPANYGIEFRHMDP